MHVNYANQESTAQSIMLMSCLGSINPRNTVCQCQANEETLIAMCPFAALLGAARTECVLTFKKQLEKWKEKHFMAKQRSNFHNTPLKKYIFILTIIHYFSKNII